MNKEHLSLTDLQTHVLDLDDQPMEYPKAGTKLTVREAIRTALTAVYPREEEKPEDRVEKYMIAKKIMKAGEEGLSLEVEERLTIKEAIGKFWTTEPLGFLNDFLDLRIKKVK